MYEYIDDIQKRFFTWCDDAVQVYIDREGGMLERWWPRKSPEGNYELVFILSAGDNPAHKHAVPVPEDYHELLEREYFINHPPDEEKE
ncbi:MAG: hypothetical protein GX364_00670 [Firmicutes bacterium]|jgi:hypothetical protein|nr:hypothetical protein [Bacillota bacterium]